jgi:hypothetical protein
MVFKRKSIQLMGSYLAIILMIGGCQQVFAGGEGDGLSSESKDGKRWSVKLPKTFQIDDVHDRFERAKEQHQQAPLDSAQLQRVLNEVLQLSSEEHRLDQLYWLEQVARHESIALPSRIQAMRKIVNIGHPDLAYKIIEDSMSASPQNMYNLRTLGRVLDGDPLFLNQAIMIFRFVAKHETATGEGQVRFALALINGDEFIEVGEILKDPALTSRASTQEIREIAKLLAKNKRYRLAF